MIYIFLKIEQKIKSIQRKDTENKEIKNCYKFSTQKEKFFKNFL